MIYRLKQYIMALNVVEYSDLAEIQETKHAADAGMIVTTAKHKWITYTISL